MTFLLYGAYGYTAQLIVQEAEQYGLVPLLAGRNAAKLKELSDATGYAYRVAALDEPNKLDELLAEAPLVLHAAGPFIHTARPMLEACLRTGTHYLDITGEIPVFAMAQQMDQRAKEKNTLLMPGVGFDVVPTDCLALYLHRQLPDATHLRLAFTSVGSGFSRGTAATMAENLGESGAERRDGKIVRAPVGEHTLQVPFSDRERFAMSIPWGDVFTAYYTTGIPNIQTYMAVSPTTYRNARAQRYIGPLLRTPLVRNWVKRRIARSVKGPNAEQRQKARSFIWGDLRNAAGECRQARLTTPNGYTLTAQAGLIIIKRLLNGELKPGFWTPAGLLGADLIMEVKGVIREDLVSKE